VLLNSLTNLLHAIQRLMIEGGQRSTILRVSHFCTQMVESNDGIPDCVINSDLDVAERGLNRVFIE
jgi:hypothetical protein